MLIFAIRIYIMSKSVPIGSPNSGGTSFLQKFLVGLGIAALGSAIAYYFYKEYELVRQWDFNTDGISLQNLTTTSATLQVKLKIINKSNVEATISNLSCAVYANNVFVGNISQSGLMIIPSKGYNILILNIEIDNSNALNQAVTLASQGVQTPVILNIVGSVKISSGFLGITIPINDTENYTVGNLLFNCEVTPSPACGNCS